MEKHWAHFLGQRTFIIATKKIAILSSSLLEKKKLVWENIEHEGHMTSINCKELCVQ